MATFGSHWLLAEPLVGWLRARGPRMKAPTIHFQSELPTIASGCQPSLMATNACQPQPLQPQAVNTYSSQWLPLQSPGSGYKLQPISASINGVRLYFLALRPQPEPMHSIVISSIFSSLVAATTYFLFPGDKRTDISATVSKCKESRFW